MRSVIEIARPELDKLPTPARRRAAREEREAREAGCSCGHRRDEPQPSRRLFLTQVSPPQVIIPIP